MSESYRSVHTFFKYVALIFIAAIMLILTTAKQGVSKPPAEVPGTEITEEEYFDFITPRDSIEKKVPPSSPYSPTWLDKAAKTWDAPPISVQIAEDKNMILIGMGAVFIPYMSNPGLEPDIEILNNIGKVVASGKTGRKYSLMPDSYHVILGSESHEQKIIKAVQVTESDISLVFPDWCGLSIDLVNEDNQPFRGEYELARMDKFEPFGRGFGRNPDLGENIKTWILKPGTYKIFGVGESYNTLTNFVTVRLLPGEFVRFVLVENENDMKIVSGGTVQLKASSEIGSNWKYGIDVGGGIDFNYAHDRENDTVTVDKNDISLLFYSRLNYRNNPYEWDSRFKLDEGVTFSDFTDFDVTKLSSSIDELRLTSIFTWRVLPWLGPYGRVETSTEIIPERARRPELTANDKHNFIILDSDSNIVDIDSINESYRTQPAFSPITLETGAGANMNILNTRYFDARVLTGIGFTYEKHWDEWKIGEVSEICDTIICDSILIIDKDTINIYKKSYTILIDKEGDRTDIGPEVLLNLTLRIGRLITIESELKYFAPFSRIAKPDLHWRSIVSWRLARMITLDYEYKYTLVQAEELKQNESRHRVLIRFSYLSR